MSASPHTTSKSNLGILIIGAGMSGILMGIRLKMAGYDQFTIVEKASDLGGTWRENTYPGLHCDVPSHHYCYSFELNADWTKTYSGGLEIQAYLRHVAEKYGIMPHIRFNQGVRSARWNGAEWEAELETGEQLISDVLVSATGFLRVPMYPEILGLEEFSGPVFHTARWDHSIPLADKRVGMIGTGSTSVQITCALAGEVKRLILFQRTAQWVAAVSNPEIPEWQREQYREAPSLMRTLYETIQQDTARQTGGAIMGMDPEARAELECNVEESLATVKDPELRRRLTPNWKVGCKRLIISPSFYEAVQDPDVEVVTERIDHIEANGIVTADGTLHGLDVLVLATGFDPSAYVRPMALTGVDGHTLDDVWVERPVAYRSITVPHMPNFFMIGGPFSPIANLSLFLVSEWQVDYIMKCIDLVHERGIAMAPQPAATAELIGHYREAAKKTIWATGGCNSWYQDEEGVPMIYPFSPDEFRDEIQQDPVLDDYDVWSRPVKRLEA